MKYFDAQKRAKTYVKSKNIKILKKVFNSSDYLKTPVIERLAILEDWISQYDFNDFAAVDIEITVEDKGETVLSDEEIFEIMSNAATAYARAFEKQKEKVMSPKQKVLDGLPISPFSVVALTMLFQVDKPLQIVIHRHHRESDSYERIELI